MLKLFLKKHKKKGFTLTETIVVVALIAMIMACIVGFSGPIRSMVSNSTAKSDAITINGGLSDYIKRRLSYANRVDAYTAIDIKNYDFESSMTAYKSLGADNPASDKAKKNISGVLIFHYVPADTDKGQYAWEGTYKVYDVPLMSGYKVKTDVTEINNESLTMANIRDAVDKGWLENYRVFNDAYYGDYQYFIAADPGVGVNISKQKAFMTLKLMSFNFKGDDSKTGITDSVIKDHFEYNLRKSSTSLTEDKLELLARERTGTENISLSFENMSIKTIVEIDSTTGGSVVTADKTKLNAKCICPPETDLVTGAPVDLGTDTLIFYNIRRFYADSTYTKAE